MPVELGWLDTNIFVHAVTLGDPHRARCLALLDALTDGRAEGSLSPLVAHELSYVLLRRRAFPDRGTIAAYLLTILNAPGMRAADKALLLAAVDQWSNSASIGFVDAYLAELARRDGRPVCTVNARDFPALPNSYATATL